MTLLISAFTKRHAILASDRRLAYLDSSGKVHPRDEDACKLIHYDGRFLFAYTGPASLEGTPTDIWMARTLQYSEADWHVAKAMGHLALRTKEALSRFNNERYMYFTAICVGWQYFKGSGELKPAFGHISTYVDKYLNSVKLQNKGRGPAIYWSFRRVFERDLPFVFTAGQEIEEQRLVRLKRDFRKYVKNNIGQDVAINTLYNEIIHAADTNKGKGWIGKGVLAAAISSESASQDSFFISHGNSGSGQQFRYYSANSKVHIFKGPHFVTPGGVSVTNFSCGPLKPLAHAPVEAAQIGHLPWTRVQ